MTSRWASWRRHQLVSQREGILRKWRITGAGIEIASHYYGWRLSRITDCATVDSLEPVAQPKLTREKVMRWITKILLTQHRLIIYRSYAARTLFVWCARSGELWTGQRKVVSEETKTLLNHILDNCRDPKVFQIHPHNTATGWLKPKFWIGTTNLSEKKATWVLPINVNHGSI